MKNLYTLVSVVLNDEQVYLDATCAIDDGYLVSRDDDHTICFFRITSPEGNTFRLAIEMPDEELERAGYVYTSLFANHKEVLDLIHSIVAQYDADGINFPTRAFTLSARLADLGVYADGTGFDS